MRNPKQAKTNQKINKKKPVNIASAKLEMPTRGDLEAMSLYLKEIGVAPLLKKEDEIRLAKKINKGCKISFDTMVRSNLRLVVKMARPYVRRGMPLGDLIAEGNFGLIRAVEKYDHTMGYRFSTYATCWIKQSIERSILNQQRTIRVPVHVLKLLNQYLRAASKLSTQLGHDPSAEIIAEHLEQSPKKVKKVLSVSTVTDSIDQLYDDSKRPVLDTMADGDHLHSLERLFETKDFLGKFRGLLDTLEDPHKTVLISRYGLDEQDPQTLEVVGQKLGITRERVRQIQINGVKQLRKLLVNENLSKEQILGKGNKYN